MPPWLVWSKTVTLRLEGPEGAGRRTGGECTVERGVHRRMAWGRAGPRRVRAMRPVWGGLAGGQWGSRARREGAGQSGPCQARAFALGVRSGPAGAEAAGIVFWRSLLLASRHVGARAGLSRAAPWDCQDAPRRGCSASGILGVALAATLLERRERGRETIMTRDRVAPLLPGGLHGARRPAAPVPAVQSQTRGWGRPRVTGLKGQCLRRLSQQPRPDRRPPGAGRGPAEGTGGALSR